MNDIVVGQLINRRLDKHTGSTIKCIESNSNIIYFLSGFYRKHCFKFENAWFILIILYPIDFYLDYEVMNSTLSAFSISLFFVLQILYTVKNLVVNVKQNYGLEL